MTSGPPIRGYILKGWLLLMVFFGGFGTWASVATLVSAAIANGSVKVDSSRKTIQHLDGGIVREVFVKDGDRVRQGQTLVKIDDAEATADLKKAQDDIAALTAENDALKEQLPTMQEQLKDQRTLYAKGFARKPEMYDLQRTLTKVNGDIAANEKRLAALHEAETRARLKLDRNVVTAPLDGIVMNLRLHTIGGVVAPGGPILDLVPIQDTLVIEVRIQPSDIDVVRPDLPATLRFVAYKQRMTPTVDGRVTRVSPDALIDEKSGATFFLATVEADLDSLKRVPNVKPYPGMPVEVAIVTGQRTPLAFLMQPFTDSLARAFKEQ
jgi:multidrug efflux pump subunit AcrA (membrane-fusion protein)